jgi:hypothetical protein
MFTLKRTFINFQDKLVEAVLVLPEHRVKNIEFIQDCFGADVVLRRDEKLFFCKTVEEATIISEESTALISKE